jgi:hypothetical protein
MYIVWAEFEISTGRITDAGSTMFSRCVSPADVDACFAGYAGGRGFDRRARQDAFVNRSYDAGLVRIAACEDSADADGRASAIRAAAVAVYTVRTGPLGCRDLPLGPGCDDKVGVQPGCAGWAEGDYDY